MTKKINVSNTVIEVMFDDKEEYNFTQKKLLKDFDRSTVAKSYRVVINDKEAKIDFFVKGGHNFLYETCEELTYSLFMDLHVITKEELRNVLNDGLKILNSNRFLFMVPNQIKFLLEIKNKKMLLIPVLNESFHNDDELYSYYQDLFRVMMKSLEGFVRSRLHMEGRKIFIEYYDAIDQFIYVMKEILGASQLFEQNFSVKDFLIEINRFIVKNIAQKVLKTLAVDSNYDHQLNEYRYMTLMTYKLFAKLSYNGAIENLDYADIEQLADAMTYENDFQKMPSIISTAYNNLNKVLPFKTVEKIFKRSRYLEYYF